ncbi:MAG: twin-arginine translocase TatA/TatE family subunit [Planctomycetota bacterium]
MPTPTLQLGFFSGGLGGWEVAVLVLLGVLIFGKRLPEVGKSIGKGIVEFKKGLAGVDDDIEEQKKTQDAKRLEAQKSDATSINTDAVTETDTAPPPSSAGPDQPGKPA